MRLRLLSRASDLARIQALLVERAVIARHPGIAVERLVRPSAGDLQPDQALTSFADKGAFTTDLSEALVRGDADVVVHSWKDLPTQLRPSTEVIGSLERADPRDVLVLRPEASRARPRTLTVLSSSPRRAWMLQARLPGLLPWPIDRVICEPIRGNVPTRLRRLREGHADGLVVAKAALDRLLSAPAPFEAAGRAVRDALGGCRWCVLPLRSFPSAPAQGALALEVSRLRHDVARLLRDVVSGQAAADVTEERAILAGFGGGCHLALGATVLTRTFGRVVSVRAGIEGNVVDRWELHGGDLPPPAASPDRIWPRDGEPRHAHRAPLPDATPTSIGGADVWIARADALPVEWIDDNGCVAPDEVPPGGRLVWTAGERTWRTLSARGVWVHGCADGLGDALPDEADALAGRPVRWRRLTHRDAAVGDPDALGTYVVRRDMPNDLGDRTHFYWMSGSEFREAVDRWPAIRTGWHASGPGRTSRALREVLGDGPTVSTWLDIDDWRRSITT